MISIVRPYLSRIATLAFAVASLGSVPASAAGTQYFVVVPGSAIPSAITSFSSDARADVAAYAYGGSSGARPAHGKFSIATEGSPFDSARSFAQVVVLAKTPEKLITFTFTNVTIDDISPSSPKSQRVTFESGNYDVKFSGQKTR